MRAFIKQTQFHMSSKLIIPYIAALTAQLEAFQYSVCNGTTAMGLIPSCQHFDRSIVVRSSHMSTYKSALAYGFNTDSTTILVTHLNKHLRKPEFAIVTATQWDTRLFSPEMFSLQLYEFVRSSEKSLTMSIF